MEKHISIWGVCLKIKGTYISSWLFTKTFDANMAGSLQGHGETDTSAGCGLGVGSFNCGQLGPAKFGNIEVLYLEKGDSSLSRVQEIQQKIPLASTLLRRFFHPWHPDCIRFLYALDSQPKHMCFGSACSLGWYIAWKLMDSLCVKKHLQTTMSENADHKSSSFDSS